MKLITSDEFANLRCQLDTSSLKSQIGISSWVGARTAPYAFTEHGGKREQGRYIFDAKSNSNLTPFNYLEERMILKIATWNVQRPSKGGPLNPQRLQKIQQINADIWILTETRDVISMGNGWHCLSSFPIPDYHGEGETLVTILSKWPIRPVSVSRFTACAEIIVPDIGPLLMYGTVIPWDKDEGFSKQIKAGRWEEHRRQVKVQTSEWEVLSKSYPEHLLCIAGDFNQHRGSFGSYKDAESVAHVTESLALCHLACITQDYPESAKLSKPLVDHVCLPNRLAKSSSVTVFPFDEIPEERLSDHHLVLATIS